MLFSKLFMTIEIWLYPCIYFFQFIAWLLDDETRLNYFINEQKNPVMHMQIKQCRIIHGLGKAGVSKGGGCEVNA